MNNITQEKKLTWLALGDSYTIGEAIEGQERFAAQAIANLKADGFQFLEPRYIATTGWTTRDLLNGIVQQNFSAQFDIVTLLIGVNDQYQGLDTAGYRTRFVECLEKAISFAGNNLDHVFVLSIPDYSVTPFAADRDTAQIAKEIDEFNAINKAITLSYDVSYVEITALSRKARKDRSLIASDGLHPSAKEYAKWAALLSTEVKKVLVR